MSDIGALVERLIEHGLTVGEASTIIAEAVAAGAATAAYRKSPGAIRTAKWRHKASQSVTPKQENETSQSVTERHKASRGDENANAPISTSNIKNSKRQHSDRPSRGTRIPADWKLTDAERQFAQAEGFSDFEIDRESSKFRDYWTACAGSKGVKLDWSATWRQWIRSGAERAGKTPQRSAGGPVKSVGVLVKTGTEAWDAWQAHLKATTGKGSPRSPRDDGWFFATEYPPGYEPRKSSPVEGNYIPPPQVRSMQ